MNFNLDELLSLYFNHRTFQSLYNCNEPSLVPLKRLLSILLPAFYLTLLDRLELWLAEVTSIRGIELHLMDDLMVKELRCQFELAGITEESQMRCLVYVYNIQFARIWVLLKAHIMATIKFYQEQAKELRSPNRFLVYALFKRLSKDCYKAVSNYFSVGLFKAMVSSKDFQQFSRKLIERIELIDFISSGLQTKQLLRRMAEEEIHKKPFQFGSAKDLECWLNIQEAADIPQLIKEHYENQNGQTGILLSGKDQQKFLVSCNSKGELVVVNSKYLTTRWRKISQYQEEIQHFLKNFRKRAEIVDINWALSGSLVTLTGTLGYLISHINQYKNFQQFMIRFGKESVVGGTILMLCLQMPIFWDFLVIGGFGFQTIQIVSRQELSIKEKAKKMSHMIIGNGSLITCSLGGFFLGQMAIPVPVLGAMLGGLVGGIIGGASSSKLLQLIKKKRSKQIVAYLEQSCSQQGLWECKQQLVDKLGLKMDFFLKTVPACIRDIDSADTIWTTLIAFVLLATNRTVFELELIEQLQNKKQKRWYKRKLSEDEVASVDSEIEQLLCQIPDTLRNCIEWLSCREVPLLVLVKHAEQFIESAILS